MEILFVTFTLDGMNGEDYERLCVELAPAFAAVEGLTSKIWLADPETSTYGGVYRFATSADADRFQQSELFAGVAANPSFKAPQARRFHVLDEPTRITNGVPAATH